MQFTLHAMEWVERSHVLLWLWRLRSRQVSEHFHGEWALRVQIKKSEYTGWTPSVAYGRFCSCLKHVTDVTQWDQWRLQRSTSPYRWGLRSLGNLLTVLRSCLPSCPAPHVSLGPTSAASPGSSWKMQNSRPYSRHSEPEPAFLSNCQVIHMHITVRETPEQQAPRVKFMWVCFGIGNQRNWKKEGQKKGARNHSEKSTYKAFVRVKQNNTLKDWETCKETLLMRQKIWKNI